MTDFGHSLTDCADAHQPDPFARQIKAPIRQGSRLSPAFGAHFHIDDRIIVSKCQHLTHSKLSHCASVGPWRVRHGNVMLRRHINRDHVHARPMAQRTHQFRRTLK